MQEEIRLQKYISDCGLLSRRAAEAEIRAGHVTVNGVPAELGQKINPTVDIVMLGKRRVRPQLVNGKRHYTYVLLHKPMGYVTTLADEKGRPTITDLLHGVQKRLYPVGRLDMYSEGLLLCTDDGELTNRLTHPAHHVEKVYLATLSGKLTGEEIRALGQSIMLDGYQIQPVPVRKMADCTIQQKPATVVQFTLSEGRNRQIRKMCEYHGQRVLRLTRIRMGKLDLGTLPSGKWRYLTDDEVQSLRTAVGLDNTDETIEK